MRVAILRWWAIACSFVLGLAVLQTSGFLFPYLLQVDHSRLTLVNLGLFGVVSTFIGWLHWRLLEAKDASKKSFLNPCWFASDACMAIGMMGTLVGFMMMFSSNISNIDASNIETVKGVVVQLTRGFSTSIITTLVGICLSTLMKLQLVNLEHGLKSGLDGE